MGETISLHGDHVRGAGWYGHTTGLHTVAIRVVNFHGRIQVQAAITITPIEPDWYSVLPDSVNYIQYPRPGYVPLPAQHGGESSILGFNFTTNAVWLRAIVDRSYLIPALATPVQIMEYGTVSYVMVNY